MSSDFPNSLSSKLRACKICSQLKPLSSFKSNGCENCPMFDKDDEILSNKFKGMIGLVDPEKSWVAKWQRINENKKGLYAMTVEGELSDEHIVEIEKAGKVYYDRSSSFRLE
ncbi:Transcription elongation factor SPT4 [Nosema bombycis CQ1]|uniref:Transcription elongation factor SPT4 n=1 Tax=Nosema bombycis (strain CQ1 / CVCC 102059) TaxID=578461 RepID=R0MHD6_NOSB1|nr:Transcription elongation factor SPT4 [Nosema bombycis CQ1]|eukprot:EOB12213.1 Transcription elongation factor SPT4 [Nosema bombycis CQ1]